MVRPNCASARQAWPSSSSLYSDSCKRPHNSAKEVNTCTDCLLGNVSNGKGQSDADRQWNPRPLIGWGWPVAAIALASDTGCSVGYVHPPNNTAISPAASW